MIDSADVQTIDQLFEEAQLLAFFATVHSICRAKACCGCALARSTTQS